MAGFMPDYTALIAQRQAEIAQQQAKNKAMFGDLRNAAEIAGWAGPTAIGAGLGALTAPKNKGLQSTLRGAGLGAALHAGTSLGARAGSAMGGPDGSPTGALVGAGLGGLGSTLAAQYLLPRVDDDETKKEKSAMSLYSFGVKVANVTGMTFDSDHPNVKKLKEQYPHNWRQVMAESQGLSHASQATAVKKAQSACTPCAMPNGPTNNKKPYTSASPAVTDASQKSVEIGKPPVTETEHSAAKAKLPEEGAKSAYAFGMKVAAGFEGVTGVPYSPQSLSGPSSYAELADDIRANQFSPRGAKNTAPRLSTGTGQLVAKQQHLNKLQTELNNAPRTNIEPRNMADTILDSVVAAPGNIVNKITSTGKSMANYGGPRNLLDTGVDGYMRGFNALTSAPGNALAYAKKNLPKVDFDSSGPQFGDEPAPKPTAAGAGSGADTGAAGGGVMDYLTNPYVLGGGAGALGLGGLLYYLNSQKKKKKDEGDE